MTLYENSLHASEIICSPSQAIMHRVAEKYGRFLFIAYGCALMEQQTDSGSYIYTAVNLETRRTATLIRRNKPLDESAYIKMAAKLNVSAIRGSSRFNIEKKPSEMPDVSHLTESAKRIFTDILPSYGYTLREKQLELAEHILAVIGRRSISLAESEVGTGKTHAYLVAALLAKRGRLNDFWMRGHYPRQNWAESAHMPMVISTSSIALQSAIAGDYIPELSRILLRHGVINTPLTAVVRKGKENFICEKRLQRYCDNADERTRALLAPYVGPCAPFDLTGADSLTPHMKRGVCVSGGKCTASCVYSQQCRYLKHMREINDPTVDFQITNHNYFLADVLHRIADKRPLLPHYQMVIIDEAHKFLAAARSMYGLELTETELPGVVKEIHAFTVDKSAGGVNVHKLAKKLEEQNAKLFRRLNANIPESDHDDESERFPAIFDSDAARHIRSIIGIAADIAAACADSYVQPSHKARKNTALWRLDMTADRIAAMRRQSDLICWLEKRTEGERETDALCAIPKDLDARLHRDLWGRGVPIILTSGTLSASGDFTRAKQTLGLIRLPERLLSDTSMPSPFDYKNNALLYISENVPFPDSKDKRYIAAVADEVERLVTASHGHAAVLFTSYNAMGQVHTILKERGLPFPLFRLERGGTGAIERFKRSGNGILLASGALWEGIDIPGDALSLLIIVKLPFAVPDPIGDYEKALYPDISEYRARVLVPDMLVKLKQGFGRLIRTEKDTGAVAIFDCRMREGGPYRERVLHALPDCRVTTSVSELRDFIAAKKHPIYWE